jgi:hypothetical protein
MNTKEVESVYDYLSTQGTKGSGYLTISNVTGIQPTILHKFLKKHSEFFVSVGGASSYRLKSRGDFDGSKQSMIDILATKKRNKKLLLRVYYFSIFISLLSVFNTLFIVGK